MADFKMPFAGSLRQGRSAALTFIGGALLLASCSQTPAVPQDAAAPQGQGLGVFELRLSGRDAQVVPASGLSTQAAVPFDKLSFEFVSMDNVPDPVGHANHMTATFRIKNGTGRNLTLPTFVPVATSGTYATVAGTPFRNITTSDGTAANDKAGLLSIEVSQKRDASGVLGRRDAATPLVTLDPASFSLNLPAGTAVTTVSNQGWQSKNLPAGASTTVTFAVRGPMTGGSQVSPSADPYRFNLVFAVAEDPKLVDAPISPNAGFWDGGTEQGAFCANDRTGITLQSQQPAEVPLLYPEEKALHEWYSQCERSKC